MQNDLGIGAIGALVGAGLTAVISGIFGWFTQRSKDEADHGVAVLAEWSKLNAGLTTRLADVERECAQMRRDHAAEIERIRHDHAEQMEEMRRKHRAEMRSMRELNEGLQRMIAQNSQSAAHLISDSPVTHPKDDDEN